MKFGFSVHLLLNCGTVKSGCIRVHILSQDVVQGVLPTSIPMLMRDFCTTWQHAWTRGYRPRLVVLQNPRPSATPTEVLLEYAMQGSCAWQKTRRLSLQVRWRQHAHLTVPILWPRNCSRQFHYCSQDCSPAKLLYTRIWTIKLIEWQMQRWLCIVKWAVRTRNAAGTALFSTPIASNATIPLKAPL